MFVSVIVNQYFYPIIFFFFFNDTATTEIYTLSLHDALPISLVAHDQLVLGAPGHRRGPDQARCVSGRKTPTGNRREGVDVVDTTRIDEVSAVAVGVVVRQLEVTARAELHGDFGEYVLSR